MEQKKKKGFFDNIIGGIKKWATTPKEITIPARNPNLVSPDPQDWKAPQPSLATNIQPTIAKAQPQVTPAPQPVVQQTPTPTPMAQIDNNIPRIENAIRSGYREYGGGTDVPMSQYSKKLAELSQSSEILKKYPYLIPAISIRESSAGKNTAMLERYPNNPVSWGIYAQKQGVFQPKTTEETLEKMASGISGRYPVYQKFVDTGDIMELLKHYAPPSENDTQKYYDSVIALMDMFKKYENQ